jgi:hypothetical protein
VVHIGCVVRVTVLSPQIRARKRCDTLWERKHRDRRLHRLVRPPSTTRKRQIVPSRFRGKRYPPSYRTGVSSSTDTASTKKQGRGLSPVPVWQDCFSTVLLLWADFGVVAEMIRLSLERAYVFPCARFAVATLLLLFRPVHIADWRIWALLR